LKDRRRDLGKKRGPREKPGPLGVKVENLQRGTAAAVALGGKRRPSASAENDMGKWREDFNAECREKLQPQGCAWIQGKKRGPQENLGPL